MITEKSSKREIKDLQRLLVATGLMELTNATKDGKWGVETQAAVLRAYSRLGWKHAEDERWISTPALAAVAAMFAEGIGAGGSNIGTSGSNIGTSGSNIGTSGSNIGGDSTPD